MFKVELREKLVQSSMLVVLGFVWTFDKKKKNHLALRSESLGMHVHSLDNWIILLINTIQKVNWITP